METHKPLLKDTDGEDVDEHLYRSTIESLMYVTSSRPDIMFVYVLCKIPKLISWQCKKQTVVANSITEAEYIAAYNCYGQIVFYAVWLVQQAYMGEGSGQPTDPQHTFTSAQPSHKEPITIPSSLQPKKTHRPSKAKRATEISQSSGPISLVADETVTKETEDRIERVATTASSLWK
ncbi:hypothetical protein Tco_0017423 [Tanacetum coccineum]